MIWSTRALQDTTIYESDPYRNTGLDSILELKKEGDVSTNDFGESRILIKFDLDELSTTLSDNGININNITANLILTPVQSFDLPKSYTIEARMISEAWENGSGYFNFPAAATATSNYDGATWKSVSSTGSLLWTSGVTPGSATLYVSESGGGRFLTGSVASQSFSFNSSNTLNLNVTDAVKFWYNGTYNNNGLLISYRTSEITSSNYPTANIQFYSSNTTTVFEPQLYIQWSGSQVYSTGSMTICTYEDDPIIYTRSFKGEYLKDKKVRVLLAARPKFPRPTFNQNSSFATMLALPSASYYQIKDAHNDQIIIPYSNYTKINTNSSGSYFDFYTTMMYPERYYKFEVKSAFSDFTEYFSSNDFTFKIIS